MSEVGSEELACDSVWEIRASGKRGLATREVIFPTMPAATEVICPEPPLPAPPPPEVCSITRASLTTPPTGPSETKHSQQATSAPPPYLAEVLSFAPGFRPPVLPSPAAVAKCLSM